MTITRNEPRLARKRLARLMPLAEAKAAAHEVSGEYQPPENVSLLGATVMPHASLDRLDGVHIYQTSSGRFHADPHFHDLPAYLPNVLGTPRVQPLDSERESEAWAAKILAHFILAKRGGESNSSKLECIPFEVHGYTLLVPLYLIEAVRESGAFCVSDAGLGIEEAYKSMGHEITDESLARLPEAAINFMFVSMASLLIAGVPRYPLRWPLPD